MSQAVIIKSSKCGITLVLDSSLEFQKLLDEIKSRFKESEKFFANASFAISFEGRALTEEEKYQIVDVIMAETSIRILCIMEEDEIRDSVIQQKIQEQQHTEETQKARGSFYYGSLAEGEHLETDENIVIVGDVLPGASVVSNADIVVLGALRGSAYAGMSGKEGSFISALDFAPESYNIAGIYGEPAPKSRNSLFSKRNKTPLAMIATAGAGIISVRPFN